MATTASTPAQYQANWPTPAAFAAFANQYLAVLPPATASSHGATGTTAGAQFTSYYAWARRKDPAASLGQIEEAFTILSVGSGLSAGIGSAVTGTGAALGQIATGTAIGTAQATQTITSPLQAVQNFLAALSSSALWLRVAKVVIGGALLLIGLARMSGADKVADAVTRHVPIPI